MDCGIKADGLYLTRVPSIVTNQLEGKKPKKISKERQALLEGMKSQIKFWNMIENVKSISSLKRPPEARINSTFTGCELL